MLADRLQVRTARDQGDGVAALVQARPDGAADGAGPEDDKSHATKPTTAPRARALRRQVASGGSGGVRWRQVAASSSLLAGV